jgi:hypothetical protein
MPCPKCGGYAERIDLVTAEGGITVNSCMNCGRVFGEAVIDYHQGLEHPPEPRPPAPHRVWVAHPRRLTIPAPSTPKD